MPADQPFCPLGRLTKTSGTSADFLVRVFNPKASKYPHKAKGDGKLIDNTKFSCILLGEDAGHYGEAIIKGAAAEVAEAMKKFLHGTSWKLSRVNLDGHQNSEFLHTSVRVVVDLKRTTYTPILGGHQGG